jgi:hypothetical protein
MHLDQISSESIILAYNNLSCSLLFLKNVVRSKYLDLSGNQWEYNSKADILPHQLTTFRCEYCGLKGSFDIWIRRDSDIELYLSGNLFNKIPDLDGSTLRVLDLSNNPINTGAEVVLPFDKLGKLTDLDLSFTGLSGDIPSFLFNLQSLKLAHNNLSSLLPISLFSPLRELDLSFNDILVLIYVKFILNIGWLLFLFSII